MHGKFSWVLKKQADLNAFIQSGKLKEELANSAEERKERIASGKRPVIGLNKFQNKKKSVEIQGSQRLVSDMEKNIHVEGGKVK